jgi:hypothetical protein
MKSQLLSGLRRVKGTVLELMAKRMPAADVEFLASRWGYAPAAGAAVPPQALTPQIPTANAERSEVKVISPDDAKATEAKVSPLPVKDLFLLHPILGELVSDLGYKKIYLTSVRNIAGAPVWQKQRTLRVQRAALIAKTKIKNGTAGVLPGVISLYMDRKSGTVGIIDGQHRAAALVILAQEGQWNDLERNIAVDVFETSSESEITTLFTEINAAEPVKLVDMPVEVFEIEFL